MSYIHESVIYNIYPLGYCGAPKENDRQQSYRLDKIYDSIDHFKRLGVNATIRRTLGADINASCGQLRRAAL